MNVSVAVVIIIVSVVIVSVHSFSLDSRTKPSAVSLFLGSC